MENEMIERVAKAIFDALPQNSDVHIHSDYGGPFSVAAAAIEAMREPTEAMVCCKAETPGGFVPYPETCAVTWRAMIDAALHHGAAMV